MTNLNRRSTTKHDGRLAANFASRIAKDIESYSKIHDEANEASIPHFEDSEIVLGDYLGTGGFNQVYAVERINLLTDTRKSKYAHRISSEEQTNSRSKLSEQCEGGKSKLAIKFLKNDIKDDVQHYADGAADLVIETKILANLPPHENIIKLHGVAAAGTAGFSDGSEKAYFLLIDHLSDTLNDRIKRWRVESSSLLDRKKVALDVASALTHLHDFNIIFRDLKPDNVGFDCNGTVKLFDFGLAKELDPRQRTANDNYEMSGNTGSRRYMAPEVVLCQPYSLTADTYTFSILLWELCSLKEPYAGMSVREHTDSVVCGEKRPTLDIDRWSDKLCNILRWAWMADPEARPPMKEIRRALKREIKPALLTQKSFKSGLLNKGTSLLSFVKRRRPSVLESFYKKDIPSSKNMSLSRFTFEEYVMSRRPSVMVQYESSIMENVDTSEELNLSLSNLKNGRGRGRRSTNHILDDAKAASAALTSSELLAYEKELEEAAEGINC